MESLESASPSGRDMLCVHVLPTIPHSTLPLTGSGRAV